MHITLRFDFDIEAKIDILKVDNKSVREQQIAKLERLRADQTAALTARLANLLRQDTPNARATAATGALSGRWRDSPNPAAVADFVDAFKVLRWAPGLEALHGLVVVHRVLSVVGVDYKDAAAAAASRSVLK